MKVNVAEKKVERQLQFWAILGPFVLLLSLFILLFKVSDNQWYFALSSVVGIPLCLKWKMRGLAGSLLFLFCMTLLSYQDIPLEERYWHIGMSMALALSFVILTLSIEEVQGVLGELQNESQSRLEHLFKLDEKLKAVHQESSLEKDKLLFQIKAVSQELAVAQEEKKTFEKLSHLAKEELLTFRGEHEKLLQDLIEKKISANALQERIDEMEETIQGFVNSDPERQMQTLVEQLALSEQTLQKLTEQNNLLNKQLESLGQEREFLQAKLQELEDKALDSQRLALEKEEEAKAHSRILSETQVVVSTLLKEKENLAASLARLQSEYEDSKDSERQQRNALNQYMEMVQTLKTAAEKKEQELYVLKEQKRQLEENVLRREKELKKQLEEASEKWQGQLNRFNQEKGELLQSHQEKQVHLSEQLSALQEQLKAQKREVEHSRSELEQKQEDINSLQTWKEKTLKENEKLATENKELLQQLKHEHNEWIQKTASLQALLEEKQRQMETVQTSQQQKEQEIEDLRKKESQAQEQLSSYLKQIDDLIQQVEKLSYQEEQLKQEFFHANQELTKQPQLSQVALSDSHARKIEAMYAQLKTQFEEKSQMLDHTRKELFHTQEKLSSLQKEWEEQQTFEWPDSELSLQQEIGQLEREWESAQKDYQQEVDTLYEVIGQLFQQLKSKGGKDSG